jgi:hypothetical protein
MRALLGLSAGLLLASPAESQVSPTSTTIDASRVTLGMTLDQLRAALYPTFKLSSPRGSSTEMRESFFIMNAEGPPYQARGTVSLVGGKVAGISREWLTVDNPSAVDLGTAFFRALDQLSSTGASQCSVTTKREESPSVQSQIVDLTCRSRTISLLIVDYQGDKQVSVTEILPPRQAP